MGFIFYMFVIIGGYIALGMLVAYKMYTPDNPLATMLIVYLWPLFALIALARKLTRKD